MPSLVLVWPFKGNFGQFFFVLKAGNGEVIGHSEMYETERSRDNGIESVRTNGPSANIIDAAAASPGR